MRGLLCACAVGLLAVVGCGGADPFNKQPLTGSVTVKGKLLPYGQIFFEPAEGQKFATNATINDGKFVLTKETGLSPGKYSYRLMALDREEKTLSPAEAATSDPGAGKGKIAGPSVVIAEKDKAGEVTIKAGADNKLDITIP